MQHADRTRPAPRLRPDGSRRRPAGPSGRARWALLALVASLCACSQASRTTVDTLRLVAGGQQVQVPTAEEIAASPYARIHVEGGGLSSVMVLGNDDAGRLAWYGGGGYLLFLRDGLVAGSRGLAHDADDIRIEGDNPFLRLATLGDAPVTVARRYDWREGYRYGVAVEGRLQRRGTQTVEILGTPRTLVHFEETLSGPGVRGSNHYWADPATGFIWKSRQLVAPGTTLEIVQLKPYARSGVGG